MIETELETKCSKLEDVPAAILVEAARLVDLRFLKCFWFRHEDATVDTWDDVYLVVRHLREYGGHTEWREAQSLWKLVLSCR